MNVATQGLADVLTREGLVDADHLQQAMMQMEVSEEPLISILRTKNWITADNVLRALCILHEVPIASDFPDTEEWDLDLILPIPVTFAKQYQVLPMRVSTEGFVETLVFDPMQISAIDDLSVLLQKPIVMRLASSEKILQLINKVYGRLRQGAELDDSTESDSLEEGEELVDLLDVNDEAPIIRWVNSVMFQGVKERASDIHFEPNEKEVGVRYRVDGVLREAKTAPKKFLPSIIARIKIMSGLDIAEKRLPQDGRIRRRIAGKDIDMRVATVPTAAGERVTIRLLDRTSIMLGLPDIGMAQDMLDQIRSIIERPHGILLVTGPTGSGKTTTLYACLAEINSPDLNILTVEDPVEYQLPGISQTQVNSKIDLSFATGLRSFLRHDPDVIMVGEIRDKETAEIAITASLTGHFVFSTIHTNDSAGGITRLIDMGIEPFLVVSSLVGLLAQRLVRRPCLECAELITPSTAVLQELGLSPDRFFAGDYSIPAVKGGTLLPTGKMYRAVGCKECQKLGYSGRTGVYEMLFVDDVVRKMALEKADASAIKRAALEQGMVSLRMDGARKCMLGMTTPEEVLMVTSEIEGH